MMSLVRELRLIPVVLFATVCLLALKVLGIVVDGGYTLGDLNFSLGSGAVTESRETAPVADRVAALGTALAVSTRSKMSWAQEMFNFPDATGSIASDPPAENQAADKAKAKPKPKNAEPEPPIGTPVLVNAPPISAGERAMLERLQERRLELDTRARELDIRENLLKSAEKQLDSRVDELKDLEARIKNAMQQKDEAEAARFKGLVTMYENMKAKDAAKIFDRLELRILIDVASQINPRRMSDILAQMQPEAAERLTVELANRASAVERVPVPADLPKIEGKPTTQ